MLAVSLAFAAAPASAQQPPTEITQFVLERSEDGVLLSAAMRLELPQIIDDALQKGIPMFFVADAVVLRDRWYWYDREVASAARYFRLSYQPLTRRWRLQVSNAPIGSAGLALGQSFETRDDALAALRRISQWKIAESADIEPDIRYSVDFRFRLDVSQLPRPFQIGAVGQADWNISTSRRQRLAAENIR